MYAEQFSHEWEETDTKTGLRCSFCEGQTGTHDSRMFLFFERGASNRLGVCCGSCVHRMGIEGSFDVCAFCFLPILSNPQQAPNGEDLVVCDHCIKIFTRLG